MSFEDLDFQKSMSGVHARHFFPNGYGVSVVCSRYSYGGDRGLYEPGVVKGTAKRSSLTYETPVTDDVIGNLTPEDVTGLMADVAALPAAGQS